MLNTSLAERSPQTHLPSAHVTHHVRLCQIIEATRETYGCVLRTSPESGRDIYTAERIDGQQWRVVAIILADQPRRYHSSLQSSQPEKLVLLECLNDPTAHWTIELDRLESHFDDGRLQEVVL